MHQLMETDMMEYTRWENAHMYILNLIFICYDVLQYVTLPVNNNSGVEKSVGLFIWLYQ